MPLFILTCLDKPASLELRMATREAHLTYVKDNAAAIRLAGPVLDAAGDMAGSHFILEMDDKAGVEAFSAADPYAKAGLFQSISIWPWRAAIGTLTGAL